MGTPHKVVRRKPQKKPKKTKATLAKVDRVVGNGRSLGFPATQRILLKYADYMILTASTGAMVQKNYAANSIYDPDRQAGGHSPFGSAQQYLYYNHSHVVSSVIKITFCNTDANPCIVGAYLADDTTAYTAWDTYAESNRGTQQLVPNYYSSSKTVSCKFNHKGFYKGVPNGDDAFVSIATAGCAEEAYFKLYAQSLVKSSDINIYAKVEILYEVVFSEPKDLAQSA